MSAEPSDGAETLAAINEDYRAWLTVYDSTIDYPVVQGPNDLYYASHDVYGNSSLTGAIYLAAGNSSDFSDSYNLIYGHHMDNGAMFGSLDRFLDRGYFHSHQTGIVVTKNGIYDVTFFAAVKTDAYEKKIYTVGNRASEVISFLMGDRNHDVGVGTNVVVYDADAARNADKVIALSTCADAETNGRLVIFGRMTPHVIETPTPEPTDTPTPEPTSTDEPTEGPTDEPTVTPEETATARPTETPAGTVTPTVTPSNHPTVTHTPAPTDAPISTPIPTNTPKPGPFNLQIRYEYLDGSQAASTWYAQLMPGEEYSRDNPEIRGFITARKVIQGVMGEQDTVIVVLYIPIEIADQGVTISIDEYEIPLGIDNLHAQMGVCVE